MRSLSPCRTGRIQTIVTVLALLGSACSSDLPSPIESGSPSGGGAQNQGGSLQMTPQAGGPSGGSSNAGTAGTATGGMTSAGHDTGGSSLGGSAGNGGRSDSGGGGAAGSSAGAGGNSGVMRSDGCGKTTRTLQNGNNNVTSGGASRKYILRVPDAYDSNKPYRLVLAYAWSGASASQVVSSNYFTFASSDPQGTIFIAPEAANGAGSWSNGDLAFTDAILTQVEADLCIDKTHVFATGFSFGGAMSMALACTRADVFRAVAFFSGADLTNSCPATLTKPIAYFATQASEDGGGLSPTSPITGEKRQADFAAVNGCTPVPSSTTFPASGQPHSCTNYLGCSAGHPTEYCVFNGPHGWEPKDPGQAMSWAAPEAWKFITQF
ncbi:MAG TPA: hypothetical protein VHB79_29730 [Polyangiaceae bacterium]|nr:hypothetical protein [Polyangiaceae bacterium]